MSSQEDTGRKLITLRPDSVKDVASGLAQYFTVHLISLSHLRVLVAPWWVKYSKHVLNEMFIFARKPALYVHVP